MSSFSVWIGSGDNFFETVVVLMRGFVVVGTTGDVTISNNCVARLGISCKSELKSVSFATCRADSIGSNGKNAVASHADLVRTAVRDDCMLHGNAGTRGVRLIADGTFIVVSDSIGRFVFENLE